MKKYAPVIFVLIFFCIPNKADGEEFIGGIPVIYGSFSFETTGADDSFLDAFTLGLGVGIPFFGDYSYFFIEPEARIELTPYPFYPLSEQMLLRMQTGLNLGKLVDAWFMCAFVFYGGLSGMFMYDFTNNSPLAGISPQIGVTFTGAFFIFVRVQFQYEWYTDQRYNRFVITSLCGIMLGDL